jgi:signal transduction histidine kinase
LQPLAAVALEIASRDSDHLVELRPARAPEEVRPLVEAINSLFTRVEQTLESERRFTADAAHELRTPLAALTAQAQVAMQARSAAEREHAMAQLATSLRRATRLVDQILTLARLDPEDRPPTGRVDLGGLAEEVCARHGALALEKDIALELNAEPVTVPGDSDMLRILLRNLVDNAIRYTPVGGQVTVAVTREGLSVTDSGPGIPVEERARVFNRFHRLAGQDIEGSGLGLSIVARIAERHGAAISLDSGADGRGLKISVRFPVSARQAPSGVS